jgi:hypothetical protein
MAVTSTHSRFNGPFASASRRKKSARALTNVLPARSR